MTTAKRTIRGEQYNIAQLVDDAIAAAAAELDVAEAEAYLRRMGHTAPDRSLLARVARDMAILANLKRTTGAAFDGQLGKIGFDNRDRAIQQVNAYLDRRNAGHRSRWNK